MSFINQDFPGSGARAQVLAERCDGCAFCVDVCPMAALKVSAHSRYAGRRMVALDESQCQGCGVCQSTCPKEAVCIPGLSPAQLRAYIDAALQRRA